MSHTLISLLLLTLAPLTLSSSKDYTIQVAPGKRECFFEKLKKGNSVDVEYQVLDGGDYTIDTSMHTPSGTLIFTKFRQSEASEKFVAQEDGEYELCFDNGVSTYYDKIVFFEVVVDRTKREESDDEDYDDDIFKNIESNGEKDFDLEDGEEYDAKINDFKYRVERVKGQIEKISHHQTMTRSIESKDRHIAEKNYEIVNFYSMVNLGVMVSVMTLQVFTIRSLFEEKSFLNRQLNSLFSLFSGN